MSNVQEDKALSTDSRETQADIVMRMFRRKRSAVWGLRLTIALVLIAIYVPVFCCALPFSWRPPGASETTHPWFSRMFDVNYWKGPVDLFFNMLLVLVTTWFVWRAIWWGVSRARTVTAAARKLDIKAQKIYAGIGLLLILMQQFSTGFLTTSTRYLNYPDTVAEYTAARAAALESEALARRAGVAGVPVEQMRQVVDAETSFVATTTIFPYGHRELVTEQYVGPLAFGGVGRHVLGGDEKGRDLFARLLYGTRVSLTVGLVAVAIYVTIGILIGALAGYRGGRTDLIIMRFVEIVMCVPSLFLILTIIALAQKRSIYLIMGAIGIVGWTGIARLVRGEFIRERGKDYVTAARSLGLSGPRILFRHILPNAISPVIVAATFGVASAILTESTLSFLGLGDTSVPSWGQILNKGRIDEEWHMIAAPGIAIFITVTVLNLVGDGLRDALDPKLRK